MIQPQDNIKLHLNMIKQEFIENSSLRRAMQDTWVSPVLVTAAWVDDTQQQMAANSRSSQKKCKDEQLDSVFLRTF